MSIHKAKISRDELANLKHALEHVKTNKILCPTFQSGWYHGNRQHFIKRHLKTIRMLEGLIQGAEESIKGGSRI